MAIIIKMIIIIIIITINYYAYLKFKPAELESNQIKSILLYSPKSQSYCLNGL